MPKSLLFSPRVHRSHPTPCRWLRDFLEAGAIHSQELGAGGNLIAYLRQIDFRKDREEQMQEERKEIAARLLRMRQQANVVRQRSLSQEDEMRGAELGSWVQVEFPLRASCCCSLSTCYVT